MLRQFKTYRLALEYYRECEQIQSQVPAHLRDQLLRAASSIVLNIAEGSGKNTSKDQQRYYSIARGSLRECQAIHDLSSKQPWKAHSTDDQLAACLYKLSCTSRPS